MKKNTKTRISEKRKKEKNQIKELKLMLSQEEINSLEQMIKEDSGKTDFQEIKELLKQQNIKFSPSLQKINAPQKSPVILERDVITGNMSIINPENKKEENNQEFKYTPNETEKQDKKYTPLYSEKIAEVVSRKEFQINSPRNVLEPREIKFGNSFKETMPENEGFEKYSSPNFVIEKFDPLKKNKKNIFEKKEVKYTSSGY